MKRTKKVTVLVTAVGGRSVGYQILECLKKYRRDYRIITTDADAFSPGLYESDESYLMPTSTSKRYIPTLLEISKKERVEVILPGSIPETLAISRAESEFLKYNIVPVVNPYPLVQETYDKLDVDRLLKKHNLLTPKTVELQSMQDVKGFSFPVIVKPRGGSSGSRNVHVVKDHEELSEIFEKLSKENIKLLVQEYIGNENEEYTVGIVAGKDGRVIDSIVMRRKLIGLSKGEHREINGKEYVLSTGYSQGFIVDQPDVKNYCEYAVRLLGARGPFNIQARRGKKGVYIFELHPRFSGSASMRAEVGFNEPHVLIREFLGIERKNKIPHKLEYAVIRKFANTVVSIKEYEKMSRKTA